MNYIQELYEFSTAEISDALDACGVEGALFGINPLLPNTKLIGPAFTVKYSSYDHKPKIFKNAGNYIDDVPLQSVIVIDNQGRKDCTTWGDILTQFAQINKISGTIVNGAVRDVEFIRSVHYPVYSSGIYMRSGKNRVYKSDQQCTLNINGVLVNPEDIVIGDDDGVLVVPKKILHEVIDKVKNIKKTEKNIIESIKNGNSLKTARSKYRYDQPWLNQNNGKLHVNEY